MCSCASAARQQPARLGGEGCSARPRAAWSHHTVRGRCPPRRAGTASPAPAWRRRRREMSSTGRSPSVEHELAPRARRRRATAPAAAGCAGSALTTPCGSRLTLIRYVGAPAARRQRVAADRRPARRPRPTRSVTYCPASAGGSAAAVGGGQVDRGHRRALRHEPATRSGRNPGHAGRRRRRRRRSAVLGRGSSSSRNDCCQPGLSAGMSQRRAQPLAGRGPGR